MARKTIEKNISYDTVRQCYYVSMDFGADDAGRRIKRYRTYPTLPQARKGLKEHLAERTSNSWVLPKITTVEEWLDYWMEQVIRPNRAETTAYGYQKIIDNHIIPELGRIRLQKLSALDIQRYYAKMMQEVGLGANTVRRHHDLLSSALRMAVKQDLLVRCPTDRVEPPRVVPREAHFYDSDTLKKLYQMVEGHWLELVVKLAGGLGLRREEICGLRWESVDFQRQTIRIKEARTAAGAVIVNKETKNFSSLRTLHMPVDIQQLLWRERLRQEMNRAALGSLYHISDYVAVDRKGNPYSPNALSLAFTRFIKKSGLPAITLHGLRHTFATVASAQGAPLFEIGKALGHSTPSTTGRIYTHLVDTTHTATLDKVANALR